MKISNPARQLSNTCQTVAMILLLALSHSMVQAAEFTGGVPLDPQPEVSELKAGLGVTCFFEFFDHVD